MSSLALQLENYRLTTAQILYHMPDHPNFLQEFIWQELDLAPAYPVLTKFLNYWESNLDGKLHSVTIGQTKVITPSEYRSLDGLLYVH
ncbi:MAG: Usg family protein [Rhodospirillaceae bacterium]